MRALVVGRGRSRIPCPFLSASRKPTAATSPSSPADGGASDHHPRPTATARQEESQEAARSNRRRVAKRLCRLLTAADALVASRPDVDGLGKLRSRVRRDLRRVVGDGPLVPGLTTTAAAAAVVAGARNNARGFAAELATARAAPGLVAVCFPAAAAAAAQGPTTAATAPARKASVEVDVVCQGGATWIEVKAHRPFSTASAHWGGGGTGGSIREGSGSGTSSSSGSNSSSSGSGGGVRAQAAALLAAASDPRNRAAGFRAPRVAVLFPRGVDPSVALALGDMGAIVLGPRRRSVAAAVAAGEEDQSGDNDKSDGDESDDENEAACRAAVASLPPLPPSPYPLAINLDVTALCALVSEVSWSAAVAAPAGEAESETGAATAATPAETAAETAAALDRWASRTCHWIGCLAAERAEPLLFVAAQNQKRREWRADTALARAGRALFLGLSGGAAPVTVVVASAGAVRQFDALAAVHAGPREQARWRRLRAGLEIVDDDDGGEEGEEEGGPGGGDDGHDDAGGQQRQQQQEQQRRPDAAHAAATPLVVSVLSLGGRRHAQTATANGAAVRSAREHWARGRGHVRRAAGGAVGGGGGGGLQGAEGGGSGIQGKEGSVFGWTDKAAAGAMEAELHRPVWLAGM